MEKFLSKPYLKEIKDDFVKTKGLTVLNETRQKRNRARFVNEVSIFLSHKHDEIDELENVIALLSSLGVEIYIDWLDEGMPKTTSGQTASRLKSKIESCTKFIFLATEGAINSKWCNWELGLGDAKKYPKNIAVMPITSMRNTNWDGSEYLDIYPILTSEYEHIIGKYYIEFKGIRTNFVDWLKS
jgi:hypothetical protein